MTWYLHVKKEREINMFVLAMVTGLIIIGVGSGFGLYTMENRAEVKGLFVKKA